MSIKTKTMNDRQQILEKIKKLLALSHSSNPSEAAIALSRAQKLMQEHSISLEDINLSSITEIEISAPPALRAKHLMGVLGRIISSAFGLDFLFHTQNSKITSITFIGSKDRVEVAGYTFTLLSRQLAIIKKEFAKQERSRLSEITLQKTALFQKDLIFDYAREFNMTPFEVWSQIKKQIKQEENREVAKNTEAYVYGYLKAVEEKVQDYALSLSEQKLIADYTAQNYPNLTNMRQRGKQFTQEMLQSYNRGSKDAQAFNIFQGVKGKTTAKLGFD